MTFLQLIFQKSPIKKEEMESSKETAKAGGRKTKLGRFGVETFKTINVLKYKYLFYCEHIFQQFYATFFSIRQSTCNINIFIDHLNKKYSFLTFKKIF